MCGEAPLCHTSSFQFAGSCVIISGGMLRNCVHEAEVNLRWQMYPQPFSPLSWQTSVILTATTLVPVYILPQATASAHLQPLPPLQTSPHSTASTRSLFRTHVAGALARLFPHQVPLTNIFLLLALEGLFGLGGGLLLLLCFCL